MIHLASTSPRRKELLEKHGIVFDLVAASVEEPFDVHKSPEVNAMAIAYRKARAAQKQGVTGTILGCDTIVVVDDEVLGKPQTRDEAKRMLMQLQNNKHRVISGFAIIQTEGHAVVDYVSTTVNVRAMSDAEIEAMLDTKEYEGVSGAYRIQGAMRPMVTALEGSEESVIGLPVQEIRAALQQLEGNCHGEGQL